MRIKNMATIFELWDVETSNLLDAYETEQAALRDVLELIDTEGRDVIETLALLRDDEERPAKILVAEGADLAAYATKARIKTPT
jgi:hypothetical protein